MSKTAVFIISFLVGNIVMLLGFILYDGNFNITDHQSNIYSGVLGLFGGVIGAMGAYFIAKMQLSLQIKEQEKADELQRVEQRKIINLQFLQQLEAMESQLEQQFIKDKQKMKMEIEVQNIQGAIADLAILRNIFNEISRIVKDVSDYDKFDEIDRQNRPGLLDEYLGKYESEFKEIMKVTNRYVIYSFLYKTMEDFRDFHTRALVKSVNVISENFTEIGRHKNKRFYSFLENIDNELNKMKELIENEIVRFHEEIEEKLSVKEKLN